MVQGIRGHHQVVITKDQAGDVGCIPGSSCTMVKRPNLEKEKGEVLGTMVNSKQHKATYGWLPLESPQQT
jgi:hypothetical protein